MGKRQTDLKTKPVPGKKFKPEDLAARWQVSTGTLENWRVEGKGPDWFPLNSGERAPIRYSRKQIVAYERSMSAIAKKNKEK